MDRDYSNWGHDCPHKSFSKNKLVEDIVGTLVSLPLIFPYEPWRFMHDRHHAKTNMLMWHFDLKKFRTNEVKRVKISLACVFAFMAIGWPLIIYKTGIMRWIKFWPFPNISWAILDERSWTTGTSLPCSMYLRLICGLRPHTQRVEKVVEIGFQPRLDPGKFGCLKCVCNIPKLGEEGQAEKGAKEGGSKVLGQVLLQTSHILP
ncbi:hypothetical protein AHAS_Ahas20G0243100 [Arachis hypogaea]